MFDIVQNVSNNIAAIYKNKKVKQKLMFYCYLQLLKEDG